MDEAITFAVAELKAEAVQAAANGDPIVPARAAASLLSASPRQLSSEARLKCFSAADLRRNDDPDYQADILRTAVATSKEVLNKAIEQMTLSANKEVSVCVVPL